MFICVCNVCLTFEGIYIFVHVNMFYLRNTYFNICGYVYWEVCTCVPVCIYTEQESRYIHISIHIWLVCGHMYIMFACMYRYESIGVCVEYEEIVVGEHVLCTCVHTCRCIDLCMCTPA